MTPAGKLAVIQDLFDSGLICSCPHVTAAGTDEDGKFNIVEKVIHGDNCEGREKALALLSKLAYG